MKENFEKCLKEVLRHEGGYVNNKRDPGGETNFGISRRSYPNENIRSMTRERAGEIYRRDFWNPIRGDDLPAGIDAVAFDAAVNSGVSRGAKWVQAAAGVTADGKIGPQTLAALRSADPVIVIHRALNARLEFLRSLKTWKTFGRGWQRRVDEVRAFALHLAEGAKPTAKPPPVMPRPVIRPLALIAAVALAVFIAVYIIRG